MQKPLMPDIDLQSEMAYMTALQKIHDGNAHLLSASEDMAVIGEDAAPKDQEALQRFKLNALADHLKQGMGEFNARVMNTIRGI